MSENKPTNRRQLIFKLIATFFVIVWGTLVGVLMISIEKDIVEQISWIGFGMIAASLVFLVYVWWPRKGKKE